MFLSPIHNLPSISVLRTTALLTFACVMSLYLIVAYGKPEVNWGSSTQAQTYKDALLSVQHLNTIEEHVKNYRPQILVLSGHTNTRPILVNFAFLLTKKTSLLVCGHVIKQVAPHKYRNFLIRKANDWFRRHKVKGFYTLVDDADFETGSKALMQATGVGKLKPNILLLGFKNDWISCDAVEREQYFNVLHKVLDLFVISWYKSNKIKLNRLSTCILPWQSFVSLKVLTTLKF